MELIDPSLFALLKKYDRPGPRYTSYPPAPIFNADFGHREYREELARTNQTSPEADLSLYVHLPFCDTLCYFCGCTMLVTSKRDRIAEYLKFLQQEIELQASMMAQGRKVVQMHWGGGTPTYLDPAEISTLASLLLDRFAFDDNPEISCEIDPRGLSIDHMRALRESGFNRVSMGVQDFDPRVQEAVNRIQPEAMTRTVIDWCRSLGFQSLNLDLIYGLPLQTVETFERTLDTIIDISPERLAVYNFAYVPWMKPHQKLIHPEDLPAPDTKIRILASTIERLTAAGYVYIGMDHFAKPGDELNTARENKTLQRNFQGYSTKAGCDLFGFGMSAISHFSTMYAQNFKTLPEYYRAIAADDFATHVGYRMTRDDIIRKHVILRLMCDLTLDKLEVSRLFDLDFNMYFQDSLAHLQPLMEDNLIAESGTFLQILPRGRLFLRNIAMCFDAYLQHMAKDKPIFSRTV